MLRRVFFFSLGLALFGLVGSASAVFYDVSVSANDVSFAPQDLIVGMGTKIYATVSNNGERDVEGTVRFYDGDALIGAKLFSVRAGTRPEDAWVNWTPQVYGDHTLRVVVDNDGAFMDAVPANNAVALPIFVDRDTDKDGVPDRSDDDRDNDLVLNVDEARLGTDPLKADTDGDGVNDRLDVFPLDPLRSKAPTPVAAPLKIVTPPVAAAKGATPSVPARRSPVVAQLPPAAPPSPAQEVVPVTQEQLVDLAPEAVQTTQATSSLIAPSSTGEVPILEVIPAPVTSTSHSPEAPGSSNWILAAAAAISAATAGFFIWLGRRA